MGWAGPGLHPAAFLSPPSALRPAGEVSRCGPARCFLAGRGRPRRSRAGVRDLVRLPGPGEASGDTAPAGARSPRDALARGSRRSARRRPGGWWVFIFFFNARIMSFILCYFCLWKKKPLPLQ